VVHSLRLPHPEGGETLPLKGESNAVAIVTASLPEVDVIPFLHYPESLEQVTVGRFNLTRRMEREKDEELSLKGFLTVSSPPKASLALPDPLPELVGKRSPSLLSFFYLSLFF
jgi:hypothetical protein